jgi:hypothetical protein
MQSGLLIVSVFTYHMADYAGHVFFRFVILLELEFVVRDSVRSRLEIEAIGSYRWWWLAGSCSKLCSIRSTRKRSP